MIEHGLDSARKAAEALPLHLHAQHAWSTLATELQEDLGVIQHGGLMVAETAEQVTLLSRRARWNAKRAWKSRCWTELQEDLGVIQHGGRWSPRRPNK